MINTPDFGPECDPAPAIGQVFALGSARCGSTLLSSILRLHPEVLSLSEVFSTAGSRAFPRGTLTAAQFWAGLSRPSYIGRMVGNPLRAPQEFLYGKHPNPAYDPFKCPPLLSVALPHLDPNPDALFHELAEAVFTAPAQSAAAHYTALFETMARREDRRIWVERSGGSIVAARSLQQMFPDARFMLITRSGPETVLSMCDYPATRLALRMWRRLRGLGLDLLSPEHHYGRGTIWRLVERLGPLLPINASLDRRPDPRHMAEFWSQMMINGSAELRNLPPPQHLHLSYEALLRDPRQELHRLGTWLTGGAPADWMERASALPLPRASRLGALSKTEASTLSAACAPGEAAIAALLATQ